MNIVLVTGGCGFIGSNFIQYLLIKDPSKHIVNLDKLTYAGNSMNLSSISNEKYTFIKGDICDKNLLKSLLKNINLNQ